MNMKYLYHSLPTPVPVSAKKYLFFFSFVWPIKEWVKLKNSDRFLFFLFPSKIDIFISYSFLIAMAKTSNTMLNRYGKSEHRCLVPRAFLSVFHYQHNMLAMAVL